MLMAFDKSQGFEGYRRGDMLSWVDMVTYGATGPLWFGKGEDHVAKRAEAMKQHNDGDTGCFYPSSVHREA